MLPLDLKAEHFRQYPPEARRLVLAHISALQQLPLGFVPSLLREVIDYDYKFPAERERMDAEMVNLSALTPRQLNEWFHAFSQLRLSAALEQSDWVNQPAQFVEQLSAYLWSTHQLDSFREAATLYGDRLRAATTPKPPVVPRLGIAVIGQGVTSYDGKLFRHLREHGTYFGSVSPENGLQFILDAASQRAQANPVPYGHWYVDGGVKADHDPALSCISYKSLEPARAALLTYIEDQVNSPGMGPEQLRTHLARLSPGDLGMSGDTLLDRFQVRLLTEGSGTQIFSTTFVQWAAREVLRRAQPLTLVVRFAPRQRQRPMNELLSSNQNNPELDVLGSLVDADMAAYYQWINQQRLSASERSSFLVWFEGHTQAVAIGPSLPRGVKSSSPLDLRRLLSLATG